MPEVFLRLGSFSRPIQFKRPLELIRAGVYFHARGVLNTGAIQSHRVRAVTGSFCDVMKNKEASGPGYWMGDRTRGRPQAGQANLKTVPSACEVVKLTRPPRIFSPNSFIE